MKGARPLSDEEFAVILEQFKGPWKIRNQALLTLGVRTGFRISELLSLTVGDVLKFGQIPEEITVARRNMKKKRESRTVPLHRQAKEALTAWLAIHPAKENLEAALFCGRRRGVMTHITRAQAWRVLTEAYRAIKLQGKLGTHAMRKTFAKRVWEKLDHNLIDTQHAMGHASPQSTASYLSFDEKKVRSAIVDD